MSTSKANDDEAEYTHFYRKFKFQQDLNEPTKSVSAKRMQVILNHYQSVKNEDEKTTAYLLEKDLSEYSNIIDNKNGFNNYAQYIKALSSLASHPASDYSKWTSSLQPIPQTSNATYSNRNSDKYVKKCFLNLKRNLAEKNRKLPNEVTQVTKKTEICNFQNKNKNIPPRENFGTSFNNMPAKINVSSNSTNKRFELSNEPAASNEPCSGFRTAKTELKIQNIKKYGNKGTDNNQIKETGAIKRSLGGRTRTVNNKFIPPIKYDENEKETNSGSEQEIYEDERLKNLDPKMIELIKNEIMDHGKPISWDDIAGLQFAKTTIQEIVVWPLLRPDIFTGLRRPPKGILLFGPPGTGKTLIGKCIASQSSSTFFSISASSLTSKWIGESEKLVRTLFAVARCYQPAVIFIDEIDSLLSQRSETEHESSRRIKTEFLVQLDGATTHEDDRILVIGATNRPQELDEAARRRLVKRLYIPLPEFEARCQIVNRLMSTERNELTEVDVNEIGKLTDGYSGADMKNLCQEASLGPIRSIDFSQITSIESHEVRPVTLTDFISALKHVRSSVSPSDLIQYLEWDKTYGSSGN